MVRPAAFIMNWQLFRFKDKKIYRVIKKEKIKEKKKFPNFGNQLVKIKES
jgi:hypothetical protein